MVSKTVILSVAGPNLGQLLSYGILTGQGRTLKKRPNMTTLYIYDPPLICIFILIRYHNNSKIKKN